MRSAAAGAVRTPSRGGFVRRGLKLGGLVHPVSCLKVARSACETEPAPSLSLPIINVHVEPPTKLFFLIGTRRDGAETTRWNGAEMEQNTDAAGLRGNGTEHNDG